MIGSKKTAALPLLITVFLALQTTVLGQAGLRDSLDKMDKNENGYLDPNEVTTLARPFLERILGNRYGRRRTVDFDNPIPISSIQEAARYYFAIQNGVQGTDVRPESKVPLKDFTLDRDDRIVPDFGISEVKFPYIKADLDEADRTMARCDRNRDGFIDRNEAASNQWTHRNPYDDDLNKDGKLTRLELAQRYARRRLVSEDSGEFWKKWRRTGSEVKPSVKPRDYNRYSYQGPAARLAYDLISRFDTNRDRRLAEDETKTLGIPFADLDENQDSFVTQKELETAMNLLSQSYEEAPEGLPTWFNELDKNRNEQIEMSEFSEDWTEAKLEEFSKIDLNSDGVLTVKEVIEATTSSGAQYVSNEAEILPPKKTIVSEIQIDEDFEIEDLKVTLSLTHTYTSQLDGYLIGPDGKRIELFTAVGGSDDHFVRTIFDDKSSISIAKVKPPFKGTYRPEAIDKKQPGLSQYKGKSVKGPWQLIISCSRSNRFGMLHEWGLIVSSKSKD